MSSGHVCPRTEAARLKAVQQLSETFNALCGQALGGRKWFTHFELWLWAGRACALGDAASVAVLPSASGDAELVRKLMRADVSESEALEVCAKLRARKEDLLRQVEARAAQLVQSSTAASTGNACLVRRLPPAPPMRGVPLPHSPLLAITCDGAEVRVSEVHLQKLREMHAATRSKAAARASQAPDKNRSRKRRRESAAVVAADARAGVAAAADGHTEAEFLGHAFAALARLQALQGGQEKAGGTQAACPPAVFDILRDGLCCCSGSGCMFVDVLVCVCVCVCT